MLGKFLTERRRKKEYRDDFYKRFATCVALISLLRRKTVNIQQTKIIITEIESYNVFPTKLDMAFTLCNQISDMQSNTTYIDFIGTCRQGKILSGKQKFEALYLSMLIILVSDQKDDEKNEDIIYLHSIAQEISNFSTRLYLKSYRKSCKNYHHLKSGYDDGEYETVHDVLRDALLRSDFYIG